MSGFRKSSKRFLEYWGCKVTTMRRFFTQLKLEALDSVRGISKTAIATALWLETLLITIMIIISMLSVLRLKTSADMTKHALELRESALQERDTFKTERDRYKELYNSVLEELDSQRRKE